MANEDIKELLKRNRVRAWEVADYFGVSENTLSRKLRRELSDGEKASIIIAVEYIRKNTDAEALSLLGIRKSDAMNMTKEEIIKRLYGED